LPAWRRAELKTELKSTKGNPLIGRREITFEIEGPATPSRAEVRREIAVALRAELDQVWVRRMETGTGTNTTVGLAHVYDDAARGRDFEPQHIIDRNVKAFEQPAEAKEEGD